MHRSTGVEGTVAVIRGLQDAGLGVSLLEGGKEFTLTPDSAIRQSNANPNYPGRRSHAQQVYPAQVHQGPHEWVKRSAATSSPERPMLCDSAAQACDGRYASVYKTTMCNARPTSPPVELTEFPPQRADVTHIKGRNNFVVGGAGSGDTAYVPVKSTNYRGGMSWPDRGSVCSPRPSHEPDAFASSLRKYPVMPNDRTTEIVQRLVNYSQAKNFGKSNSASRSGSPARSCFDSYDDNSQPQRKFEIRDDALGRSRKEEYDLRPSPFIRTYDVRCLREVSRVVRDSFKNIHNYVPFTETLETPHTGPVRDRCDSHTNNEHSMYPIHKANFVDSEVQACIQKCYKESSTSPWEPAVKPSVAASLSRKTSHVRQDANLPPETEPHLLSHHHLLSKIVQVEHEPYQSIVSNIKTSNEYPKDNIDENFIHEDSLTQSQQAIYDLNKKRDWNEKLLRLAHKIHRPDVENRLRHKIKRYLRNVPSAFSDCDEEGKEFRSKFPDDLIDHLKKFSTHKDDLLRSYTQIYNVEVKAVDQDKKLTETVQAVVKQWLEVIPIQKTHLNKPVHLDDLLKHIVNRLEPFIRHHPTSKKSYRKALLIYVNEILTGVPIDVVDDIKSQYLEMLSKDLTYRLLCIEELNTKQQKNKSGMSNIDCDGMKETPTLRLIKDFVRDEIMKYFCKTGSRLSKCRMALLQLEITNIFVDQINIPEDVNNHIEKEIKLKFQETARLPGYQAQYYAKKIVNTFNKTFRNRSKENNNPNNNENRRSNSYYVYYDKITNDSSTQITSEKDIDDSNLKIFKKQVEEQIDSWLKTFEKQIPLVQQKSFREMAASELARDVVVRRKFSQIKPPSKDNEIKEQDSLQMFIFQWIRKMVDEDTIETIESVPELMERIQSIPMPKLIKGPKIMHSVNEFDTSLDCEASEQFPDSQNIYKQLSEEIFLWCNSLPDKCFYNNNLIHKELLATLLAESMKKIFETNQNDDAIINEIDTWIKTFMRKEPNLIQIGDLVNNIKVVQHTIKNKKKNAKNVSLQAVAIRCNTANNTENTIDGEEYIKEITKRIDQWLAEVLPNLEEQELRQIALEDLAEDIADRNKYFQLNPDCHVSDEDELEYLKYQIFKWLYKLVGDENLEILDHASDLMIRLRTVTTQKHQDEELLKEYPVEGGKTQSNTSNKIKNNDDVGQLTQIPHQHNIPLEQKSIYLDNSYLTNENTDQSTNNISGSICQQTQHDNKTLEESVNNLKSYHNNHTHRKPNFEENYNCFTSENCNVSTAIDSTHRQTESGTKPKARAPVRLSNPSGYVAGPMASSRSIMFHIYPSEEKLRSTSPIIKQSGNDKNNGAEKERNKARYQNVSHEMTLEQIYKYYDKILRNQVQELSINDFHEAHEEQKDFGRLAKKEIYNRIWKTYVTLKSYPNIEKDYSLFQKIFEEQFDLMLDENLQIKKVRYAWKQKVISTVIEMLKHVHSITYSPSFKEQLAEKFNSHFIGSRNKKIRDQIHQIFVTNTADAYILYNRSITEDSERVSIYRQHLMKRLKELAEHIKRANKVEFGLVDRGQIIQQAFQILREVPLPDDNTLKEEADKIQYLQEVEKWYRELPVKPVRNLLDNALRNRMREMLARKLHALEKQLGTNNEKLTREIKREVSVFLENNGELEVNEDENINVMVEELTNRLMFIKMPSYNEPENNDTSSPSPPQTVLVPSVEQNGLNERSRHRKTNKSFAGYDNQSTQKQESMHI